MAVSRTPYLPTGSSGGTNQVMTDLENTLEQIASAAKNIRAIYVDNSASASASFLKLFDSTSAVLGTTVPTDQWRIPSGEKITLFFMPALAYGTGIAAAVTLNAIASDTTVPGGTVNVELIHE